MINVSFLPSLSSELVRVEPKAYQAFLETGRFVDGTQIALHLFGSQSDVSINRTGFVIGGLHMAEIHYMAPV